MKDIPLLQWLLLPIIALIVFLFWKGSALLIKLVLLVVPLAIIIGWFIHEGAFRRNGGGLETMYGTLSIAAFLLCYEIGMLIHRFYLSHKGLSTKEDGIFLLVGLVLLLASIVWFMVSIS